MKNRFLKQLYGFSVMEILIVIILLSVLVVFALPNMRNSQTMAEERNVIAQLRIIHGAVHAYVSRYGRAPTSAEDPSFGGTLDDCKDALNKHLGTNIIMPDNFKIICNMNNYGTSTSIVGVLTGKYNIVLTDAPLTDSGIANNNPSCVDSAIPENQCKILTPFGATSW